jgi:DNA-binding XRE family transcriptional regulator
MNYLTKPDKNHLHIFHEGRKRRIFVAELSYNEKEDRYELVYDQHYLRSKNAIPVGPDLSLFKQRHRSEKGKIFLSLLDRIPEKSNPAYKDYCNAQGISASEKNPIILLGAIGRRGPSSFVFEPVYSDEFNPADIIKLRELLQITQYDFAKAFDISKTTLQRIESGVSQDINTLKRIQILFKFPEVALWQLRLTGSHVHDNVLEKLIKYFRSI